MKSSKTYSTLLVFIILIIPHMLHYVGCKKNHLISFDNLKTSLFITRGITVVLLTLWINYFILNGKNTLKSWIPPTNLGLYLGTSLVIIGQILNFSVYNTLGVNGVYYGIEYNKVKIKTKKKSFSIFIIR